MSKNKYHDYVFKDGVFVGQFELMYKDSGEIPWHQNKTAKDIFTDLDLLILKHMQARHDFKSVVEIGCGLGFVCNRVYSEVENLDKVSGIDISQTALKKARQSFPQISFFQANLLETVSADWEECWDVVISKEVLWYVLENLQVFCHNLAFMSSKNIFISQSFPAKKPYFGQDIFPDAKAMLEFFSKTFKPLYSCIEKDGNFADRELLHLFLSK